MEQSRTREREYFLHLKKPQESERERDDTDSVGVVTGNTARNFLNCITLHLTFNGQQLIKRISVTETQSKYCED